MFLFQAVNAKNNPKMGPINKSNKITAFYKTTPNTLPNITVNGSLKASFYTATNYNPM